MQTFVCGSIMCNCVRLYRDRKSRHIMFWCWQAQATYRASKGIEKYDNMTYWRWHDRESDIFEVGITPSTPLRQQYTPIPLQDSYRNVAFIHCTYAYICTPTYYVPANTRLNNSTNWKLEKPYLYTNERSECAWNLL